MAILWALVAIVVAVTVAVLVGWVRTQAPAPVRVTFVYTIDASSMLQRPIADFNRAHITVDGHRVIVTGVALSSGEAERGIARGSAEPDVLDAGILTVDGAPERTPRTQAWVTEISRSSCTHRRWSRSGSRWPGGWAGPISPSA